MVVVSGSAGPGGRSDADLLAAHVAGDPEAFGVLVARHRDRLWAVALRTTGHPEDAADALQDAMVSAFRRASTFRGDSAVTTWLHRVVVNACLDRHRAAASRRTEPLDPAPDRADPGAPDPAAAGEAADRRRRVLAALATLPAEQRAALVLVDMEGYRVDEVAAILDCAPGTVKSRCSRGRARLAEQLRDLLDDTDHTGDPPPAAAGNRPPPAAVRSTDAPRGPPSPHGHP